MAQTFDYRVHALIIVYLMMFQAFVYCSKFLFVSSNVHCTEPLLSWLQLFLVPVELALFILHEGAGF